MEKVTDPITFVTMRLIDTLAMHRQKIAAENERFRNKEISVDEFLKRLERHLTGLYTGVADDMKATRASNFKTCYVGVDWSRTEAVLRLWEKQYKLNTALSKEECYKHIAEIVGDITHHGVKRIIEAERNKDGTLKAKLGQYSLFGGMEND